MSVTQDKGSEEGGLSAHKVGSFLTLFSCKMDMEKFFMKSSVKHKVSVVFLCIRNLEVEAARIKCSLRFDYFAG